MKNLAREAAIITITALMIAGVFAVLIARDADASTVCKPTVVLYAAGYPDPASTTAPDGAIPITSPGGIFPWEAGGFDHGQQVGAANAVRLTDQVAADCPGSQIKVHGHSYGAAIVHTALATIDQRPYAGRVHIYLTGDPRRIGGIEDTFKGVSVAGITMRGHGVIPQHVASYTNICNEFDFICHATPPWVNPVLTVQEIGGYLTGQHRY